MGYSRTLSNPAGRKRPEPMTRIGVFVCHCGLNIAGTVDVETVTEVLQEHPDVVLAADYKYMCSDPGQTLIQDAIEEHDLDAVVVAACSPAMHETTFGGAAADVGLNRYRLEIANIREQVSWPHQGQPQAATRKAVEIVRTLVEKVSGNEELSPLKLPIVRRALVIGGGIAGLTAALDVADAGYPVLLVEKQDHLGGHLTQHSELYLNLDSGDELLNRRIQAARRHPHIEILTEAEVVGLDGYVGNFSAHVRSRGQGPEERHLDVGAVVLATGFDLYDKAHLSEYGGDRYPDVIDSLEFEEMLREGTVRRPSDGRVPQEVVWVQCAGSRAPDRHRPYCSKICCMYVAKQVIAYRRLVPTGQAYVFYIDIRSQGRGYDEFVQQAMEDYDALYLRGKVSKIAPQDGRLAVWGADTLIGDSVRLSADLVVLATAAVPSAGSDELARRIRAATDESGFLSEAHPKLRPVESLTAGIYLAGACQFPKDIPETISQASGAAAKVLRLFSKDEMTQEPTVAYVIEELCSGCGACVDVCPYDAREIHPQQAFATVNAALCQNCGACLVACPNKASRIHNWTPEQILAMADAVMG